jgi:dihydroxy-acid dehydratase
MFTANSMNCLAEALGMALPGNGTVLATNPDRDELYRRAARQVLRLIELDLKPRDIVTRNSIDNALILDMAMGGSTNTVLHTLAMAQEAEVEYSMSRINELSQRTPNICKVAPSSSYHVEDVDRAGGISAILKEIAHIDGLLDTTCVTVTGATLGENIADAEIRDEEVIRPIANAYSPTGGLSVLTGSLAPHGSVVKTAGVDPEILVHEGPAIVFESQEEACKAILGGRVKPGHVVVIRCEGPRGGPGMQEMLSPTSYIRGLGLGKQVALVTDGRFSGGTAGACIGHISPEAADGGPIAFVHDGDTIRIDIPAGSIDLVVDDKEIQRRRKDWTPPRPPIDYGWLGRYASMATSADTGAVLRKPWTKG